MAHHAPPWVTANFPELNEFVGTTRALCEKFGTNEFDESTFLQLFNSRNKTSIDVEKSMGHQLIEPINTSISGSSVVKVYVI